ncbi:hypothetical protein [Azospirillum melinis]
MRDRIIPGTLLHDRTGTDMAKLFISYSHKDSALSGSSAACRVWP